LRDAIQAAKLSSLQGPIAFDPNGDILTRTVSIYQWRDGEIKYVAVAPQKERPPADPGRRHGAGRPRSPSPPASPGGLLQQIVNGLALGMMYALLALGFTMVYGIIELINFAHFSVFMTGTFVGLVVLNLMGVTADSRSLTGQALVGILVALFAITMAATGALGVLIERVCLRPLRNVPGTAPMITTIGVAFILINVMLLAWGPQTQRFPQLLPSGP